MSDDIFTHTYPTSLRDPDEFTRAARWTYRFFGVGLQFGASVSELSTDGRRRQPAEANALDAWEWEGGRTDVVEVPR